MKTALARVAVATAAGAGRAAQPGSLPGGSLHDEPDARRRARRSGPPRGRAFGWLLVLVIALLGVAGLAAGSEGWSFAWNHESGLLWWIRAPRTLGALLTGALLGLAGAVSQGLFRNPLADPYLLGSAAGAGFGIVLVLSSGGLAGGVLAPEIAGRIAGTGMVAAAFAGALGGVVLTLILARGASRPMVLLLAGVVVGVVLAALSDLLMLVSPQAMRSRYVFLLGSTGFLGWKETAALAVTLALTLPLSLMFARALDALVLGEHGATSLGVPLPRVRLLLVGVIALCTGSAVAQTGLIAFVGLVAPHLVRRCVRVAHGPLLLLSTLMGGALLQAADVAARTLVAPAELPVGVLTAVFGGAYLLLLLRRRAGAD